MFRYLLSSRLIQAGLVFFVLAVGGSLLYSWHSEHSTESGIELHFRLLQECKDKNEPRPAEMVGVPTESPSFVDTPEENAGTPMSSETEVLPNEIKNLDITDAFLQDDLVSEEEAPAEEVAVSPFGFGLYPEIPADYPFTPFWLRPPPKGNKSREQLMRKELLSRVMVKAWTDGDHNFIGAGLTEGRIFLNYPDVIYVKYGEPYENREGELVRPITRLKGAGIVLSPEDARNGVTPPGYQVIEFDGAGYDPYTYLDLP